MYTRVLPRNDRSFTKRTDGRIDDETEMRRHRCIQVVTRNLIVVSSVDDLVDVSKCVGDDRFQSTRHEL